MTKTIWLVWADRGDYSDHTEYAVCWFATKEEAEQRAALMQEKSVEWRRKVADSDADSGTAYGALWMKAQVAIGDPSWSPGDDTDYTACELEHGGKP